MKVLLVALHYAPERSGTAPYTTAWARHMAESHDVQVLAGLPHYPEWRVHDGYGAWRADSVDQGVKVRRLKHYIPASTSLVGRLSHELSFAARALSQNLERPDVVLSVSPALFGAVGAARLAARFDVPFGLVVQDIYSEAYRELGHKVGRREAMLANVEPRLMNAASGVLTIHDRFRRTVVESFGTDPRKVMTVGNWAQVPVASRSREQVRHDLGWGEQEFVILHAGNMGVKQGLENVVSAAMIAHAEGTNERFVLLGDGNQRRDLEERARFLPNLTFLPSADQADYPDVLAAADVLLINQKPGVAEMSVPSKLTSYCAAGRPIIAAVDEGSATADAVKASGAGLLVTSGLPRKILRAAEELRTHPESMAALGDAGKSHAVAHQSFGPAMSGYDTWLDRVTATSLPRAAYGLDLPELSAAA